MKARIILEEEFLTLDDLNPDTGNYAVVAEGTRYVMHQASSYREAINFMKSAGGPVDLMRYGELRGGDAAWRYSSWVI